MRWDKAALAIMCMPCRHVGGHFVPTSELLLASLDADRRHPVIDLATGLRNGWAARLRAQGVEELIVAVDDLAVERSWMLPPHTAQETDPWPQVQRAMTRALTEAQFPCRVLAWSQLVDPSVYESQVADLAQACLEREPSGRSELHRAMGKEIARRRRFHRTTGLHQEEAVMRRYAADQVANYAAQGELVHAWGVKTYLPWTGQEAALMGARQPRFTQYLADFYYGGSEPSASVWERLPARFTELVQTLRLYADDLPSTPGAVRPGLATAVADAVADLLTPGTQERGLRRMAALNEVMPGGSLNRARVRHLLARARAVPSEPGWALEQVVKKLYCQLTSRYNNQEDETERARHQHVLTCLAAQLERGDSEHVALALTGSLPFAQEGIWHPYFSDIDVMPLFITQPPRGRVERLRAAYTRTPRPHWLLLNEGARAGVAGLTHDPTQGLFAADRLDTLTTTEFDKLSRLVEPMRHIAGSPRVFSSFRQAHRRQQRVRTGEATGVG